MGQAFVVSVVLRFPPFHVHAHKSSACHAWTSAALRLIKRMLTPRITLAVFVLFIPTSRCVTKDGTVWICAFFMWCILMFLVCKMSVCFAGGIGNQCNLIIWIDLECDLHTFSVGPTTKAHKEHFINCYWKLMCPCHCFKDTQRATINYALTRVEDKLKINLKKGGEKNHQHCCMQIILSSTVL